MGYFPTYALGNVVAGMVYDRLRQDMDVKNTVRNGDMSQIKTWLREHIHRWGSTYSPKELQQRTFGEIYNSDHLVKYLEDKYLA